VNDPTPALPDPPVALVATGVQEVAPDSKARLRAIVDEQFD
jgi:hypothetical protein